jgi:hypothetical protein
MFRMLYNYPGQRYVHPRSFCGRGLRYYHYRGPGIPINMLRPMNDSSTISASSSRPLHNLKVSVHTATDKSDEETTQKEEA